MKDRIRLFLEKENKTSSQFAEEIGIQPSGVSHVLSGRNKPSLDFVIKMLKTYSDLNSDWLLFGEGEMYKEASEPGLFDDIHPEKMQTAQGKYNDVSLFADNEMDEKEGMHDKNDAKDTDRSPQDNSSERIIIFHGDGTYSEYKRRK